MTVRIAVVVHITEVQLSLRSFFRGKPTEMAIIACIFGIPSATILYFLECPAIIMAVLLGVVATTLMIALGSMVYRANFHMALFTSAVIPLTIIFGLPLLVVIPFILLLGTSSYNLGMYTPLQLTAGFLIGLIVTTAVLRVWYRRRSRTMEARACR